MYAPLRAWGSFVLSSRAASTLYFSNQRLYIFFTQSPITLCVFGNPRRCSCIAVPSWGKARRRGAHSGGYPNRTEPRHPLFASGINSETYAVACNHQGQYRVSRCTCDWMGLVHVFSRKKMKTRQHSVGDRHWELRDPGMRELDCGSMSERFRLQVLTPELRNKTCRGSAEMVQRRGDWKDFWRRGGDFKLPNFLPHTLNTIEETETFS